MAVVVVVRIPNSTTRAATVDLPAPGRPNSTQSIGGVRGMLCSLCGCSNTDISHQPFEQHHRMHLRSLCVHQTFRERRGFQQQILIPNVSIPAVRSKGDMSRASAAILLAFLRLR